MMRTTVDLSPELLERLRDAAHREGISFKELINRVVQRGLEAREAPRPRPRPLPAFSMGVPRPDLRLDKALALAFGLEDEESLRKLERRR
jgi:hypothetical protein